MPLDTAAKMWYNIYRFAGVAELADAPALGAGVTDVQVQVLSPALKRALAVCRCLFQLINGGRYV